MEQQYSTLWKEVIRGNQRSYRKLVEEYFNVLYNYGLKFSSDPELIKDTVQELFITVWERRSYLSEKVNIRAYLLSSFRRALFKKLKSKLKVVDIKNYNGKACFFEIKNEVEEGLLAKEKSLLLAKEMAEMINSLPIRQKEVVYLKYFLNLSRDEIAETMSIAPQTVSNILQTALKGMRFKYFANYKVS